MKLLNLRYQPGDQLSDLLQQHQIADEHLLVLVFADVKPPQDRSLDQEQEQVLLVIREIRRLLPNGMVVGATTAGAFVQDQVTDGSILLTFLQFEQVCPAAERYSLEQYSPVEMARQIARDLIREDTRLLLLFTDGFHTDTHHLLEELTALVPGIPVAGGKAGDRFRFLHTSVFFQGEALSRGAVAVALNGDALRVHQFYRLNWRKIGKMMTVTDACENVVKTIDGKPAIAVYQHYLGQGASKKLTNSGGSEFPLFFMREGMELARAVTGQLEDGSILYAGDIRTGERVQFSYGHIQMILESLAEDCRQAEAFEPEGILVFSCAARKTLLQQHAREELVPLAQLAPLSGFFAYGEFYHLNRQNHLLNNTMAVTLLSEKPVTGPPPSQGRAGMPKLSLDEEHLRIVTALTNLTERVTSELEESNQILAEKNHLLSQLVKLDGLTKLYNHRYFHESLEWEVKSAFRHRRTLCVGMIDLDNFKEINDRFGHGVGDQILIQLAEVIRNATREPDLVGRCGGDEFAVILPETSLKEGQAVMERVRQRMEALLLEPGGLRITMSCGVAQLDPDDPHGLMNTADRRLYRAKRLGGNQVVAEDGDDHRR